MTSRGKRFRDRNAPTTRLQRLAGIGVVGRIVRRSKPAESRECKSLIGKIKPIIPTEGNTPKAAASRTLRESFYALKRMVAPGIDGVTWKQYEVDF